MKNADVAPGRVQIWQALIAGAVALLLAALQLLNTFAVSSASEAAAERGRQQAAAAADVKEDLATSTAKVDSKLDNIHTLVNSNMGRQLRLTATALRRVADLTSNKYDKDAAEEAETLYTEHMRKQEAVDAAGRGTP